METLRYYQSEAADQAFLDMADINVRGVLLDMATGAGKTGCTLTVGERRHRLTGGRVLFVADQRELVNNAALREIRRFTSMSVQIEMGSKRADKGLYKSDCVVASKDSIHPARIKKFDPNDFSTVIIDEADKAVWKNKSWRHVFEHFYQNKDLKTIGCTATIHRRDGKGLCFDRISYRMDLLRAINEGWLLCPDQQFIKIKGLDWDTVPLDRKGDYDVSDLDQWKKEESVAQMIVAPACDMVPADAMCMIVSPSVAHAEMVATLLRRPKYGRTAVCIHGKTEEQERNYQLERFQNREVQFLCVCGVCIRGYDNPGVDYMVMARPTNSLAWYQQAMGRLTRSVCDFRALGIQGKEQAEERKLAILASAKPRTTMIDLAGNSTKHKHPMSVARVLAGSLPMEIVNTVVSDMEKKSGGGPVDVQEAVEKAKALWSDLEEDRRRFLAAKVEWEAIPVSFFDFGSTHSPSSVLTRGAPPSQKMIAFLQRHKRYREGMTKVDAKRAMLQLRSEWAGKSLSPKQQALLNKCGERANISLERGSALIEILKSRDWQERDYKFTKDRLGIHHGDDGKFRPTILDSIKGKIRLKPVFGSELECREYLGKVLETA